MYQKLTTLNGASKDYYSAQKDAVTTLTTVVGLNKNIAQSFVDGIAPIKAYRGEISELRKEMKEAFSVNTDKFKNTPTMTKSTSNLMSNSISKEFGFDENQNVALKEFIVNADKASIETQKLTRNQQVLSEYLARTSNLTRQQTDSLIPLINEMKTLGSTGNVTQKTFDNYVNNLMKIGNVSKDTANKLASVFLKVKEEAPKSELNLKQLTNTVVQLHVATRAVSSTFRILGNVIREATQGYIEFETLETSLGIVTASAKQGAEEFGKLREMAAVTPFNVQQLTQGAIALQQVGISATRVEKILEMIGNVSGGNQYKFQHILQNYAQIIARGKTMEIDIREFANMGVPIRKTLMEMGIQGNATAEEITDAFKKMTEEGGVFYNGMSIHSKTLNGLISTLSDTWKELTATWIESTGVGDFLKTMVSSLISVFSSLTEFMNEHVGIVRLFNVVLTTLGSYIAGKLIPSIASYIEKLIKNTIAVISNTAAIKKNQNERLKNTASKTAETIATKAETSAINAENKALGINVALKSILNPTILSSALALGGLAASIYSVVKARENEKKALNDQNEGYQEQLDVIDAINNSYDEYQKKLNELQNGNKGKRGIKFNKIKDDEIKNVLMDLDDLQYRYNMERTIMFDSETYYNTPKNISDLTEEQSLYNKQLEYFYNELQKIKQIQDAIQNNIKEQSNFLKGGESTEKEYRKNVSFLEELYSKTDESKLKSLQEEMKKLLDLKRQYNELGGLLTVRESTEEERNTGKLKGKDARFIDAEKKFIEFRTEEGGENIDAIVKYLQDQVNKASSTVNLAGWQKILKKALSFSDEDVAHGFLDTGKKAIEVYAKRVKETISGEEIFADMFNEDKFDIYMSKINDYRKIIQTSLQSGEFKETDNAIVEAKKQIEDLSLEAAKAFEIDHSRNLEEQLRISRLSYEEQLAEKIKATSKDTLTIEKARILANKELTSNYKTELEELKKQYNDIKKFGTSDRATTVAKYLSTNKSASEAQANNLYDTNLALSLAKATNPSELLPILKSIINDSELFDKNGKLITTSYLLINELDSLGGNLTDLIKVYNKMDFKESFKEGGLRKVSENAKNNYDSGDKNFGNFISAITIPIYDSLVDGLSELLSDKLDGKQAVFADTGVDILKALPDITNPLSLIIDVVQILIKMFVNLKLAEEEEEDENKKLEKLRELLEQISENTKNQIDYLHETMLKMQTEFINRQISAGITKVNDMILTPQGKFSTAPDDYIIATKHPEQLGSNSNNSNLKIQVVVNNNVGNDVKTSVSQTKDGDVQKLLIDVSKKVASDVAQGINGWDNALATRELRIRGRSVL